MSKLFVSLECAVCGKKKNGMVNDYDFSNFTEGWYIAIIDDELCADCVDSIEGQNLIDMWADKMKIVEQNIKKADAQTSAF